MSQVIGGVTYYLHQAVNVYIQDSNPFIPAAGRVGKALHPVTRAELVLRDPRNGGLLGSWTTNVAGAAQAVLAPEPQFLPDFGGDTNLTVSTTVELGTVLTDVPGAVATANAAAADAGASADAATAAVTAAQNAQYAATATTLTAYSPETGRYFPIVIVFDPAYVLPPQFAGSLKLFVVTE